MRVDVGDDGQLALPAQRPELGEGVAVQNADAAGVGLGIEIVVIDTLPAPRGGRRASAPSRKAPASCRCSSAAIKFADDLAPVRAIGR